MKTNILILMIFLTIYSFPQTSWQQTNGPYGASIYSIISNEENVIIGSYGGGVYSSSNNGEAWIEKNTGLNKSVYDLAILDDKLFAATRYGLFISTNMGDTWEKNTNGIPDIWIYTVSVVDSLVFAGTWGVGIYRSTDKGVSWNAINSGLNPPNIYCIAGKGEDIYCGTFGGGIYHSTNRGDSWFQASNGIGDMYTYSFGVKNDTIYAGQYNSGLFRSTDKGQHWESLLNVVSINGILLQDQEIFLSCNAGIYYTSDNGAGWTFVKTPYDISKTILLNNGFIFTGSYAGIFRSSDYGATWSDMNNGINGLMVYCMASDFSYMYAGSYASGLFRSEDGVNWSRLTDTLIRSSIQTIVINGDDVFAGTWNRGLLKSTNNGNEWTRLDNGLPSNASLYSIVVHGNEIYAGSAGDGIYYSSDYGGNWVKRNFGLVNLNIRVLLLAGQSVLAGTNGGLFYCPLTDTIWTKIDDPNLNSYVGSLVIKDNKVFSGDTSVIISTDYGITWNKTGTGLPDRYLIKLYAGNDYLWASYEDSGLYLSSDMGETWTDYTADLENIEIVSMFEKDGYIYAGTVYNGIWRRPLPEIVTAEEKLNQKPGSFVLCQNYPNPFNPNTIIRYRVPEGAEINIRVFDILGREVKTLVNGFQTEGFYSVEFNASAIPSGVYFYELKTNDFTDTKKMIIAK